jgi:xylulokinase
MPRSSQRRLHGGRGLTDGRILVAGVDCSTQATKVLIVDADGGEVLASGRAPHTVSGAEGARETDPEQWWQALGLALAQTGRAGDVKAISIAAQQHGLVVLDAPAGRPLRPAILWNDTRAAADAQALIEDLGGARRWADLVGVVPVAALTVCSWAWLRRAEPHSARGAGALRLPHDFLTERLCGAAVTDRGDASGTGWWSAAVERYVPEVLDLERVALDPRLLPAVLGPTEPAGCVGERCASALGLRRGTIVGAGTGDNMAAALALALAPGQPVISLGSSGTVYCLSPDPVSDPSGVVAGFADASGRHLPLACTLNATLAVERVASWLGIDREAVEPGGEVVVLPFLDGERTPNLPGAAATITGLRHATTPGQILRATYEGVIATLLGALEALEGHLGERSQAPIVLIGGGARGAAWREVLTRLSGRAIEVPALGELAAYGAAVQAAAVLGGERPQDVAARWPGRTGALLAPAQADERALQRFRRTLAATMRLNEGR